MNKKARTFGSVEHFLRKNFTLIELLIVVAIIAILAGMLLPAITKARDKAMEISCTGKMKQIGAAIQAYCVDSDTILPCYAYAKDIDMFGLLYPYCPGPYAEGTKLKNSTTGDYAYYSAYGEYRYLWKASSIPVCPAAAIVRYPDYSETVSDKYRPTYVPTSCGSSGHAHHQSAWILDESNSSLKGEIPQKRRLEKIKGQILLGEQIYTKSESSNSVPYMRTYKLMPCWARDITDSTRNYIGGIVHGGFKKGNWLYKDGHVETKNYNPILIRDNNDNYFMGR